MDTLDIIIIGNGFDKLHGINSTYLDFLEYIKANKSAIMKDNKLYEVFWDFYKRNSWVDCEQVLNNIFNGFEEFRVDNGEGKLILAENVEFEYFVRYIEKTYPVIAVDMQGYEVAFLEFYKQETVEEMHSYNRNVIYSDKYITKYNFDQILHKLTDDYLELRKCLMEYLKEQEGQFQRSEKIEKYLSQVNPKQCIVINFNYTNSFLNYTENVHVNHVHGKLEDESIVLGHYDCKVNVCNKKNQLYCLNTFSNFEQYLAKYLNEYCEQHTKLEIRLHIMGHSVDINDRSIYNTIEKALDDLRSLNIFEGGVKFNVNYSYYDEEKVGGKNQLQIIENMKKLKMLNSALENSSCKGYNTYER